MVCKHSLHPLSSVLQDSSSLTKKGSEIYSKLAGHNSVAPTATPLRADAVLKLGSATKLITSIALLQCIDAGLLAIDEPITHVLPELHHSPILERGGEDGSSNPTTRPNTTDITPRHLLAHTSGLGYWFTNPLLAQWKAARGIADADARTVPERLAYPLVFEPGHGWLYGCGLDWAGVAVSRVNGGVSLEAYMVEHIWKPVGRTAPFPTFHIAQHPEYQSRLMQSAKRTSSDGGGGGGLAHAPDMAYCAGLDDDEGGAGLAATMGDFLAVLHDLISDTPRLLKPATIAAMFEAQLPRRHDSPGLPMLRQLRPAWDIVAGSVDSEEVNHGLGGMLLLGEAADLGQPEGLLCWGGSPNIVWFVDRERGVVGFFGTQVAPFGDKGVRELVDGWKKDFWGGLKG